MTAWADQIAAAKRDTAVATGLIASMAATGRTSAPGVMAWLTKWKQSLPMDYGCRHVASPTVLIGILAQPGTVYCLDCATAAIHAAMASNPDRCDCCGQQARIFHEVVVPAADVLLLFGHVCRSCHDSTRKAKP